MHCQADKDGRNVKILDFIVGFRKDINAFDKAGMHILIKSEHQHLRHTTYGWSLLIL